MYGINTRKLIGLGGKFPVRDATLMALPVAVARSLAPKGMELPKGTTPNLASLWFATIDLAKDTTNNTRIALRTMLSIVYKWGVLKGYLTAMENPVPYIPTRSWAHEPAEKKPFMADEIDAMEMAVRDGKITGALIGVAYFTITAWDLGARPDEMYYHLDHQFQKKKNDVYFEVWSAKGRPREELSRLILLGERTKRMLNWFRSQPAHMGHEHYTFRTDSGRAFSQPLMSNKLKEVCRIVGIEERSLYNTRRGQGSQMALDGHTDAEAAARLGITEEVYRAHYRVLTPTQKAHIGMPSRQR
jgi:hypothetical protein